MDDSFEMIEIFDLDDPEAFKKITDTKELDINKAAVYAMAFFVDEGHQLQLLHIKIVGITPKFIIGKRHYSAVKKSLREWWEQVDDFLLEF